MAMFSPITCVHFLPETSEQGEPGTPGQMHSLQPQRRDGGHRDGERRVHHAARQLAHRLGQKEGPQCGHPRHQVLTHTHTHTPEI